MAKDGVKSGKTEGEWIYKENRPSICSDSGLYSFYNTMHALLHLFYNHDLKNKDSSVKDNHLDCNLRYLSRTDQVCAKLIWYGGRATGKTRCIICSISIELRLSHFILIRFWRSQHYQICHWFIWCEHRTRSTLIIIIRMWIGTIGRCGKTFLIYVMELVLIRNSSYQKGLS